MLKCRFCRSKKVVRRGLRYNELKKKQLYLCKSCNRKFTVDDGFLKFRHDEKIIRYAVRYYTTHSLSEVQEELRKKGVKVSRWTISKWHKRFAKEIFG